MIVENQLEGSDHAHLGQILTYAAGTDPTTIVWITTGFRDEHRAALDWLNERTDEDTRFFGVEIIVVRIGDSAPAPNFKLVAQPNDWGKHVRAGTSSSAVSERVQIRRAFWEVTLNRIRERHPHWTAARTTGQDFCDVSTGVSGVRFSMSWIRAGLVQQIWFGDQDPTVNEHRFAAVMARRAEFEAVLGEAPAWDNMDGMKATKIVLTSPFMSINDRDQWPAMAEWLIETQERFRRALDAIGGIPA
ncbi:hypothetical protein GCM10011331_15970 [Flavimobilis marinus]|nr:hypothetical protein GCM10011331_15970 [Flavimobilis marinus]